MKNKKDTVTVKEIKERFTINKGHAKDNLTDRLYFCPVDLGFNFTIDDCKGSACCDCWGEVKDYLEFREKAEK